MKNPLEHLSKYDIILGSGSPRRSELLSGLKVKFRVIQSDVEEIIPADILPEDAPVFLAELKANDLIGSLNGEYLLITADTVVIANGKVLGKPQSRKDAFQMIKELSNTTHKVITGVCIQSKFKKERFQDLTEVRFDHFTDHEINWFISQFNVMDKAGAYGIQDGMGLAKVTHLNGSYYNVMGLPTAKLYHHLLSW